MEYGKLARKKKDLRCPYCGSSDVESIGRPYKNVWEWNCIDCRKLSRYGYTLGPDHTIKGVELYPLKGDSN